MKYAILESGGKQYIAREGESIEVDRLALEEGSSIEFEDVLMVVDDGKVQIGTPYLDKAMVNGTVAAQIKGPKIIVYKYIPKQRYRRKLGHRQKYTRVAIDSIQVSGSKTAKKEPEKSEEKPAKAKAAKKQASKSGTKKKASSGSKGSQSESKAKKAPSGKKKGSTSAKSKGSGKKGKESSKKTSKK
jgi:large subunit ribosomal protein L21